MLIFTYTDSLLCINLNKQYYENMTWKQNKHIFSSLWELLSNNTKKCNCFIRILVFAVCWFYLNFCCCHFCCAVMLRAHHFTFVDCDHSWSLCVNYWDIEICVKPLTSISHTSLLSKIIASSEETILLLLKK